MPCLILCMWQQEGEEQSSWTKERAAPVCRVDMAQPFARRTKDGRRDSLQQLQPFAVRGTRNAVLMELDKKRSPSAEFFSDKRPLALRALGPGAEGKELGNDASRQPSTAAASRASAAQLLMADAKEAPRGASRLTAAAVDIDAAVKMPAAVGGKAAFLGSAERPPSSMIATAAEPASSTVEAATRLRAPPTGNAEQLNAEQLPQAAQPRPAELLPDKRPVALQALAPGADGRESDDDTSRQPSTIAASRASAARLLMMGAAGTPRGASRLIGATLHADVGLSGNTPALVGCKAGFLGIAEQQPSSITAAAAELSEPVSSSGETATGCKALPTGDVEQLVAKQLPQEAQSRSTESFSDKRLVASRDPGPRAQGKDLEGDAPRQPSTTAASRVIAARLLMTGAAGTPRGVSTLTGTSVDADTALSSSPLAAVACNPAFVGSAEQQLSSMTAASAELREPVSNSGEAATGCRALPTGGSEQLVAKHLPQEAQSRSTESFSDKRLVASRDPGPRAQGKDSEDDPSRQPSTTAASRVIAARLLMTGAAGTPRGASRLIGAALHADVGLSSNTPAAVGCKAGFSGIAEQQPSSMAAAVKKLSEPVSSSEEAATGCRVLSTGNAEQLVATQLPQEAQSRSTESCSDKRLVALRDPGPRAEDKDTEDDASRQPSTTAASRVIAARLLMTGATGTPRGASSLTGAGVDADVALSINTPAAVGCNPAVSRSAEQRPRSMTTAAAELSEPVSGSVEAATGVRASNSSDAEQNPGESQEAGQGSFGWRSIRGSIRGSFLEAGSHFKKRRWTLLLVTPTSHLHIHEILSCITYELSQSSTLARQALCEFVSPNSTKGAPARCKEPSSDARIATDLNDDFWKLLLFAAPIILGFLIHGNPFFCLAQMGNKGEDRRFSMPIRRVQKRLTNDIVLRDRRWGSIFGKTVLPQRQVGSLASTQRTASLVQKTYAYPMQTHGVERQAS